MRNFDWKTEIQRRLISYHGAVLEWTQAIAGADPLELTSRAVATTSAVSIDAVAAGWAAAEPHVGPLLERARPHLAKAQPHIESSRVAATEAVARTSEAAGPHLERVFETGSNLASKAQITAKSAAGHVSRMAERGRPHFERASLLANETAARAADGQPLAILAAAAMFVLFTLVLFFVNRCILKLLFWAMSFALRYALFKPMRCFFCRPLGCLCSCLCPCLCRGSCCGGSQTRRVASTAAAETRTVAHEIAGTMAPTAIAAAPTMAGTMAPATIAPIPPKGNDVVARVL